jgi:hypothetical protein
METPKTRVVNMHHDRCDVYIGRGGPFGNPYVIGRHGNRAEVIRKFAAYFKDKVVTDLLFGEQVLGLKGKTLGCFCAYPDGCRGELRCHGQIIAGYLDGLPPEQAG